MAPGVLQSFFLIFTILQVCKNRISKCFEIQIHKSLLWDHFFSARTCRSHHGWEICGSLEYKRLDEEGSGCRRTHHHFHTPGGRVISHDDYDRNWYQAGRRCRCWMCSPVSNGPDRRQHKHIGRDPEETRDTVALQRDNDHQALRFWKRRWTLKISMMLMVMMSHQGYNDICRKGTKTLFGPRLDDYGWQFVCIPSHKDILLLFLVTKIAIEYKVEVEEYKMSTWSTTHCGAIFFLRGCHETLSRGRIDKT